MTAIRRRAEKTSPRLLVVTLVTVAGIFVLDLLLPLGVAVGMLYVAPVLISSWSPRQAFTLAVAMASMSLTLLGFLLSPLGGTLGMAVANCSLTLCAILVTAILALRHKETLAHVKNLYGLLPICASCKKIRDDRGSWNHIETYLREHSEAEFTHGLCPECQKTLYPTSRRTPSSDHSQSPVIR